MVKQLELVPFVRPRNRLDTGVQSVTVGGQPVGFTVDSARGRVRLDDPPGERLPVVVESVTIATTAHERDPMQQDHHMGEDECPGQQTLGDEITGAPAEKVPLDNPILDRSSWSRDGEKPPMQGLWEVTDHKTGTLLARWWFGGVWWVKGDPREKGPSRLDHDDFVKQYAWRGLRLPHPDVYQCPPYASYELVERAMKAGLSIKTTYVNYRATAPGKGTGTTQAETQWPTGRPRVKL